eukprot:364108-Chlamydomonas_euryale.AAC.6
MTNRLLHDACRTRVQLQCADELVDVLRDFGPANAVDMDQMALRVTLDVIGATPFPVKVMYLKLGHRASQKCQQAKRHLSLSRSEPDCLQSARNAGGVWSQVQEPATATSCAKVTLVGSLASLLRRVHDAVSGLCAYFGRTLWRAFIQCPHVLLIFLLLLPLLLKGGGR